MTEQQAALASVSNHRDRGQIAVGMSVVLLSLVMAVATWQMGLPEHADPGARWVPGLCAAALCVCGCWLVWEAVSGGWRNTVTAPHTQQLQIGPWVWVTTGMLLMGLLITPMGFVLAASVGYVFVMQGLRRTAVQGPQRGWQVAMKDGLWGLLIAYMVLTLFASVLGVQLPLLMDAGWL